MGPDRRSPSSLRITIRIWPATSISSMSTGQVMAITCWMRQLHRTQSEWPAEPSPGGGQWVGRRGDSRCGMGAAPTAPRASIVVVEANSDYDSDLYPAVDAARNYAGVSVVSMSWGSGEFPGETSYDNVFTTPVGHQGVTFLAATGDYGSPGGYPAYSPNVVAVGGTTLTLNSDGSYKSEVGWSKGSDSWNPQSRQRRRHEHGGRRAGVPAGRPEHRLPNDPGWLV